MRRWRAYVDAALARLANMALVPTTRLAFSLVVRLNRRKTFYVFDIDNTIGDTWPTFHQNFRTESERLAAIPAFEGLRRLVVSLGRVPDNKVLFISARRYRYMYVSRRWLRELGIALGPGDLFLVPHASEKLKLVQFLDGQTTSGKYYDDLSFNHERGEIRFYETEIAAARMLKHIRYVGYEELTRLQRAEER